MSPGAKHLELLAQQVTPLRHPYSEFEISQAMVIANDLRYPRAGVRQQADGDWLVLVWYAPQVVRCDDEPMIFGDRDIALNVAVYEAHQAREEQLPEHQVLLEGIPRRWVA